MKRFLHKGNVKVEQWLNRLWYSDDLLVWGYLLRPFAYIYQGITCVRRAIAERFFQEKVDVPVIIVGNLTVGGVGKTPLVIALANRLQALGIRVAVVSRGYRAMLRTFPYLVSGSDSAILVGDEPFLIHKRTGCPVVISPKRMDAVHFLLKYHKPQVILSDDGLQHYKMGRVIEIVVIDGVRQLGNRCCLPAGPLREPLHRLDEVDFIVMNGADHLLGMPNKPIYRMDIHASALRRLLTHETVSWSVAQEPIAAVSGIGHPERFFSTLQTLHIPHQTYVFPDHHPFHQQDFEKLAKTVVMTEKDAVKCASFATETMYYLPIEATLSNDFWDALWLKLGSIAS